MLVNTIYMDKLLGNWRLKENNNFNSFLMFTQTSWLNRRVALNCSIDVYIARILKKPLGFNHYNKQVNSLFYNMDENIILDGNPRLYDKITKKYFIKDDVVNVDIVGTIVNWKEQIYINNDNLIIKYIWMENNLTKSATQEFNKRT